MLSKHPQLLELLDVPQVMDNCLKNELYDDALRLYLHVKDLDRQNPGIGLLTNLSEETERVKQSMTQQLVQDLRGNRQLPDCLKIVSLLRKLHVFSETEIRIKFLQVSHRRRPSLSVCLSVC